MEKTIDIIRKSNPEDKIVYGDSLAVIDADGVELYKGACSTCPNPYQPESKKPWPFVYAMLAEQSTRWTFIKAHPKFGDCVILNAGMTVKTLNPNQNHLGEYIASEIFIHKGYSAAWRGSRGCITVPDEKFFTHFTPGESGKLILRKAV